MYVDNTMGDHTAQGRRTRLVRATDARPDSYIRYIANNSGMTFTFKQNIRVLDVAPFTLVIGDKLDICRKHTGVQPVFTFSLVVVT
jgi:hypothetical protein